MPDSLRAIWLQGLADGLDTKLGSRPTAPIPQFLGIEQLRDPLNYEAFAASQLFVKDRETGELVPLRFNWVQRQIDAARIRLIQEGRRPWLIILKYRRGGVTTWAQGLAYQRIWAQQHRECLTLAHRDRDTRGIFEMVSRFYTNQPEDRRHRKTPADVMRIEFPDRDSVYRADTAGATASGRGGRLDQAHFSEVAQYKDLASLHDAVTDALAPDAPYIWESTPFGKAGRGEAFYKAWQIAKRGESRMVPLFFAWHQDPRNRMKLREPDEMDRLTDEESRLQRRFGLDTEQMRWWREKRAELMAAGRGSSAILQEHPNDDEECLSAGERVGTSKGIVPISEVEIGSIADHGRVVGKECRGIRPVLEVLTTRGYRLRCTADHRVAEKDGFTAAADLTTESKVRLEPPVLSSTMYVERWDGFGGSHVSLRIDQDWGRLLGYYMGDGSLHGTTLSVHCTAKDQDVVEDVEQLIRRKVGAPTRRKVGGGTEVRVARKELVPLFRRLGLIDEWENERHGRTERKRRICVPECIWRSPRSVVREFVRALFEANGWIDPKGRMTKFFAQDLGFCQDVQLLLLALGVVSKCRPVTKRVGQREYSGAELYLSHPQTLEFIRQAGFVSARKREREEKARQHRPGANGRTPDPNEYRDTVALVEPAGEDEVWDLQIDGEPVFSGSGLLVHNCFLEAGLPYYDAELIAEMSANTRPPIPPGELEHEYGELWHWIEKGVLRIFEEPRENTTYVIGSDPAEGVGADDSASTGFNARSGEQAFSWAWNRIPPDVFGSDVLGRRPEGDDPGGLGWIWKSGPDAPAFQVVERINHGHAVLTGLLKLAQYPEEWVYHHVDELRDGQQEPEKRAGWPHNHIQLATTIGRILRESFPIVRDQEVVNSIRRVELNKKGTAEFTGRDLAVALGLSAIGLEYAPAGGSGFAMIGGQLIDLNTGEVVK